VVGEAKQAHAQEEEEQEEECCVCLGPMVEDDDDDSEEDALGLLACGHRLHEGCIDVWNSSCQAKGIAASCPLCRSPLIRS
jgi:hypothetical protein